MEKLLDEPIAEEDLNRTTGKMMDIMRRQQRLDGRSENEVKLLATNDANLMLTSLKVNTQKLNDQSKRILWANCYIVTNSVRYIIAASELGLKNVVSTTPSHLVALIENIGGPVASDTELVQLLENPLLAHVVNIMWPDLDKLLRNGIALAGKSLVRLRLDLDCSFHQTLVAMESQDQITGELPESEGETKKDFVDLISDAESLGYGIHPLAIRTRDAFSVRDAKDQKIKELEDHFMEFEGVIAQFGKKKQRYLRRILKDIKK